MKQILYLTAAAVAITLCSGAWARANTSFIVPAKYEFMGKVFSRDGLSAEVKEGSANFFKDFKTGGRVKLPDPERYGHVHSMFREPGWLILKRVEEKDGKKKRRYSLFDPASGKVLLKPFYTRIYGYMDGCFAVEEDGAHYILDGSTFERIAGPYDKAVYDAGVSSARIITTKDRKQQLVDARGRLLNTEVFDRILRSHKEYEPLLPTAVTSGGKRMMGYLDARGQWAIKPVYKWAGLFHQGRAMVETHEGKRLIIDPRGNVLPQFSGRYVEQLSSGHLVFTETRELKCKRGRNEYSSKEAFKGLADRDGNVVLDAKFTSISFGYARNPYLNLAAWTGKSDKSGKGCKPITTPRYYLLKEKKILDNVYAANPSEIFSFQDKASGLYGFRQGRDVVIAPAFEAVGGDKSATGIMGVKIDGRWGIIQYTPASGQ